MSMSLKEVLAYHAWANAELLDKLEELKRVASTDHFSAALRIASHSHVVARIFASHLTGARHDFAADNVDPLPSLEKLREDMTTMDGWYARYVDAISETELAEQIAFTFTDGDRGRMSRYEMLMHVILHAGYHRGEIGQLLRRWNVSPPWDTFAVHLHHSDPARRNGLAVAEA